MKQRRNRNQARQSYLQEALAGVLHRYAPGHSLGSPRSREGSPWRHVRLRANQPSLLIEERVDNLYRSPAFRNFIGDAILRYNISAGADEIKKRLMLAVYYDRFPPGAIDDLDDYSRSYLGGKLNWFLISSEGRGHLRLLGENHEIMLSNPLYLPPPASSRPAATSLFSGQNQWLMKCLLMPGLPQDRYWSGPAMRPGTITALAGSAKVPQSSVSTFVQLVESFGYLRRHERGFVMIRHRELLEDWFLAHKTMWSAAVRNRRPDRVQTVRPLYGNEPMKDLLKRIERYNSTQPDRLSVAVSSHLACATLGISRSNQLGSIFYIRDDFDAAMSALQLVPDTSSEPWAVMIRPAYPKLIFEGAVCQPAYHAPLVDILQIYLDVRLSMARGAEQAEFIYQSILAKHFRTEAPC